MKKLFCFFFAFLFFFKKTWRHIVTYVVDDYPSILVVDLRNLPLSPSQDRREKETESVCVRESESVVCST